MTFHGMERVPTHTRNNETRVVDSMYMYHVAGLNIPSCSLKKEFLTGATKFFLLPLRLM
jgi:hypothetical protein